MILDSLFPGGAPSSNTVVLGLTLGFAVTVLLGVQAFHNPDGADGFGYNGESTLATSIFALHIATLAFVFGEAIVFKGERPSYAMLTIGSGATATLAQAALLGRSGAETASENWALAILALQAYANGLMLAIIIAFLRKQRLGSSTQALLDGAFI